MTNLDKKQVVKDLRTYVERFESQNRAAKSLKDVSVATISQMLNGNWEKISEEMWRNVWAQVRQGNPQEWSTVETVNYQRITALLEEAQNESLVLAIVGSAGCGKSDTLKHYASPERNAFRLQCSEFWNKKHFLSEMLGVIGRDYSGLTVGEMMAECIRQFKKMDTPLLILDEADKLTDQVLYFFITLYNELEDHCGIVLCATQYLDRRITKGLRLNKKGYNEIYSRIGRKFIELDPISSTDIHAICMANGIREKIQIREVWGDCEGDLRRVKRKIHALKKLNQNAD